MSNKPTIKKSTKKTLFIVGCPRSGTTWMMWLLAQHRSVVVCNHAAFFHALKPLHDWWQDEVGFGKRIYTSESKASSNKKTPGLQKFTLNHLLSVGDFYDYSSPIASHVFDKIAGCNSKTEVVVDKTPENLQFADWILKIFPNAYFLHVVRDPRSVYSSSCKAVYSWADPKEFPTSPIQAAQRWCFYMILGRRIHAKTDNYKVVSYESMFTKGPEILNDIYEWLDLKTDMKFSEDALEASTIDKMRKRDGLAPKGFFRKGATQAWKDELSTSEVRSIEYVAGKMMDEIGYQRMRKESGRRPLRVFFHDLGASGIQSLAGKPRSILLSLLSRIPFVSRLQPVRQIGVLRRTISEMAR